MTSSMLVFAAQLSSGEVVEEEHSYIEKSYRAGGDGHVANHQSTP
jgi:hypothetical protein